MREDEGLEGPVEVAGEPGDERVVGVHRAPEPASGADRCIRPAPGRQRVRPRGTVSIRYPAAASRQIEARRHPAVGRLPDGGRCAPIEHGRSTTDGRSDVPIAGPVEQGGTDDVRQHHAAHVRASASQAAPLGALAVLVGALALGARRLRDRPGRQADARECRTTRPRDRPRLDSPLAARAPVQQSESERRRWASTARRLKGSGRWSLGNDRARRQPRSSQERRLDRGPARIWAARDVDRSRHAGQRHGPESNRHTAPARSASRPLPRLASPRPLTRDTARPPSGGVSACPVHATIGRPMRSTTASTTSSTAWPGSTGPGSCTSASSSACSRACAPPARAGLTTEELADGRAAARPEAIDAWAWAADAHELVTLDDDRADGRRGHRHRPARRAAPGVPRRPVRPLGRRVARLGRDARASSGPGSRSPTRPDRYRASIERLTVQDIAVFFQEALAAAAAARRRPVTRRPRRRHPLRRRPLAHRDGPPVPGPASSSASSSSRTRSCAPGPTSRRPASPIGSRSARRDVSQARTRRGDTTWPTSSTPCTSWPTRSPRCGPPGRRSARAAGSSCSTGRCRRRPRSSGRATAS